MMAGAALGGGAGLLATMGSDGPKVPSAPRIQAPPKPEEIKDFFNYISGSKAIEVKDANGKKRMEVIRLPRNKEEQAFFSEIEGGLRDSIRNINTIIKQNPSAIPNYMPYINTLGRLDQETVGDLAQIAGLEGVENDVRHFRDISTKYLNERFDTQSRALEDSLAQRGLSNSAQGDKERRELQQNFNKAAIDNDWNALQYGENLAGQKFGNRMAGLSARQMGRDAQASTAEREYALSHQYYADAEAERSARIREQEILADKQNSLITQDYQKAMGGNVEQHALAKFGAENTVQMNNYAANSDRIYRNYGMDMSNYQAKAAKPTLSGTLLSLGGTVGGAMLTAPTGGIYGETLAGRLGTKLFG